jgi:hypothetical protein
MALAVPKDNQSQGFSPWCVSFRQVPKTTIIYVASRSDCSKGRPWLVFVVAKNVRAELRITKPVVP